MTITTNWNDKALNIALEGRLDTMTAPELEAELILCAWISASWIISLPPASACFFPLIKS